MSAHPAAVRAVLAWFDEPSPADPAQLAHTMAGIYSPTLDEHAHLDQLPIGAVVLDHAGLVLEVVSSDEDGNLWYQTGSPDALTTEAISLPATLIHLGQAAA